LLIQSTSFERGGAAIAARRWVQALEIEPTRCQSATSRLTFIQRLANRIANILFWSDDLSAHRGPLSIALLGKEKSRYSPAYFTHWVQNGFLSLFQLSLQSKRTIWYLHDEWLLVGTGHYGSGLRLDSNLPVITQFLDFILKKWKFKYLIKPALGICVPSKWMKRQLINSGLSPDRIEVIPNPIPEAFLNSPEKATARRDLNLDLNEKIVLVISSSTTLDKRKGIDLIEPTMIQILKFGSNFLLISVGIKSFDLNSKGVNHKAWNHVDSEQELVNLYASADVLFVPSRLDNLPQVVTEAQSVGLPVVAFDVGGIGEAILFPGQSGKLIEPFSVGRAAESIVFFLESSHRDNRQEWVNEATKRWSGTRIKGDFIEYLENLRMRSTTTP
jgi:glycosyltransferase involved in cell wall biosynthesis